MLNKRDFFSPCEPRVRINNKDAGYSSTIFYIGLFVFFLTNFFLYYHQLIMPETYNSDFFIHVTYKLEDPGYSLQGLITLSTAWMPMWLIFIVNSALLGICNCMTAVFLRRLTLKLLNLEYSNYRIDIVILCMMIVGNIFLPTDEVFLMYAGSPNIWHNATTNLCRLFAVLSVGAYFSALESFQHFRAGAVGKNEVIRQYVLLTVYVFLCMYAKPSFFMAFMPACFIVLLIKLFTTKGRSFGPSFFIGVSFAISMPVVLFVTTTVNVGAHGPVFEFLGFQQAWNPSITHFFVRLLLCLLFPIFVVVTNVKKLSSFEWLLYLSHLVALIIYMCFNESTGPAGNFSWSHIMCSFLSFFIAAVRLLDEGTSKRIRYIGFTIFSLHVVCGFIYYSSMLLGYKMTYI